MTLVAVSFDGFVYLVDGKRACRDVIDLGETSYSMPLVDDLTGNGKMDLVLATMNGVVYAYESWTPLTTRCTRGRRRYTA